MRDTGRTAEELARPGEHGHDRTARTMPTPPRLAPTGLADPHGLADELADPDRGRGAGPARADTTPAQADTAPARANRPGRRSRPGRCRLLGRQAGPARPTGLADELALLAPTRMADPHGLAEELARLGQHAQDRRPAGGLA